MRINALRFSAGTRDEEKISLCGCLGGHEGNTFVYDKGLGCLDETEIREFQGEARWEGQVLQEPEEATGGSGRVGGGLREVSVKLSFSRRAVRSLPSHGVSAASSFLML